MTNYYEELQLDPNASVKELNEELNRLELVWHKRELARPEEAAAKLELIEEARSVFMSAASKLRYDEELTAVPVQEEAADPDAERRAQYQQWYKQAKDYMRSGAYDLAKTAIEKALQYAPTEEEDPYFFFTVSMIYMVNKDFTTAMSYINKAIVLKGDEPNFHLQKGTICDRQYRTMVASGYGDTRPVVIQMREEYMEADRLATAQKKDSDRGAINGELAKSLYFYTPKDIDSAEYFAKIAVSFGDGLGGGQKVLDALAEQRRKDAEEAERRRKREEEDRIRSERERAAREQAEREREAKEAKKKHRDRMSLLLFLLSIAGMAMSIFLILGSAPDIRILPALPSGLIIALMVISVGVYNYTAFYRYIDMETWSRVIWVSASAIFIFFLGAFRGTWTLALITAGLIAAAVFVGWLVCKKMRVY